MKFAKSAILALFAMTFAASGEVSPQISKACMAVDAMAVGFVLQLTHLTAQYVAKFASNLSQTISNTLVEVESLVSQGGDNSKAVTVLIPFVSAVSKGSGMLVSSLANNPDHLLSSAEVQDLVGNLQKVSNVALDNHVDTTELQAVISQLHAVGGKLHARSDFNPILDGIKGSATNAAQTVETLLKQLTRNDGHPTADVISAFITGLDSQADNLLNAVSVALGPLTFGVSNLVGDTLLGPFFQSLTNGAEVLIANVAGGAVDLVTQPALQLLVHTLSRAVSLGKKNNVKNAANLEKAVNQLSKIAQNAKPATASAIQAHSHDTKKGN
ncbi:hypothetical protein B9G98_03393 [Wickerhamiella sorbophila]|uniref:Cell wall mannoprotein 1 n=1 Tax=Wickerhamiella sorbophila TaxID=45607 RepID=A0A2T0FLA4_9ASCO|nr:hypothetical protein B9G98_03393 [Wickerhamiella sorbophila]PRT55773.1 hypothetical protein B9G98_03393 [Wickerhamiella sorbophila]